MSANTENNKLVKAVMDGAVFAAVITGIGWVGKNVLKTYLEDQKIIPSNV